MAKFKPIKLTKDGNFRMAESAVQETELRYNGWRSAPAEEPAPEGEKPAEVTETAAPKPGAPKRN